MDTDSLEGVFSTYVEVILNIMKKIMVMSSVLHVCGGDPSGYVFDVLGA